MGKILVIVSVLIIICFGAIDYRLVTRTYTIITDKIAQTIRIVHLSDLHSTIHGRDQTPLIEMIKAQSPDIILMSGDIVDDRIKIEGTELLLEGIKDLAPIYYVPGNHEYWHNDRDGVFEFLESYGIAILRDSYVETEINGNKLIIAGADDPERRYAVSRDYDQEVSMRKAFGGLQNDGIFKLLIAHRPERYERYKKYPFDLAVSGHAHGGQVRIPFLLNGLIAPNQGLFPKYAGGLYNHGSLTHIVSRGLSIYPFLPRVFNPPEVVTILVEPE